MVNRESHETGPGPRPSEAEWRTAKEQFRPGAKVRGIVAAVVPFGLLVDLPGSTIPGVVTATGFSSAASFQERAKWFPVGATLDVVILGPSEGRLQIDLEVA